MSVAVPSAARRTPSMAAAPAGVQREWLVVALLTAGAFGLRLSQIHQSLFGDELWTYRDVAHHSFGQLLHAIRPPAENAPPLFFVLAWVSAKLGDPTVWIRLPSLILSTATIPLVWVLGRESVGRVAGLIGAALIACAPFTVYYAIEARPYASAAFFVALSTLALLRAVHTGEPRWWALYVLAAAAAAYAHYTAIFALAVQAAWSLWACRDRLKGPVIASTCVVLLYAPWLPHVGSKALRVIGLLEPLTVHNIVVDLVRVLAGYPYASLHAIPTIAGLIALAGCAVAGVVGGLLAYRRNGDSTQGIFGRHAVLIVALALATPAGVLLYSAASTDIWDARDLYASAPAAALAIGAALAAIPGRTRLAVLAVVLATLLIGTIRAISPSYARPPFRALASYLDRVAPPRDPIILYPSFLGLGQVIPAQFQRPHVVLNGDPARWPAPPSGGSVYVVVEDIVLHALRVRTPVHAGYELTSRRDYPGLVPFTVFGYQPVRG